MNVAVSESEGDSAAAGWTDKAVSRASRNGAL